MSFYSLLDNKCDIKRPTNATGDGMGGHSDASTSYTALYLNVPCRFETTSKKQEILAYGGKASAYPDYYLYLEYHSGIREGDHIIFGGKTFEIKLVENWSERGKYMQLSLVDLSRL